jgi:hypothetical protein
MFSQHCESTSTSSRKNMKSRVQQYLPNAELNILDLKMDSTQSRNIGIDSIKCSLLGTGFDTACHHIKNVSITFEQEKNPAI